MYANKDLLIELIDYLSNNSQITDVEIKKIVKRFNIEVKDKNKYYNIKYNRINECIHYVLNYFFLEDLTHNLIGIP